MTAHRFVPRAVAAALIAGSLALPAAAQTAVADPWVRGTVAQQTATGLFATLTSAQGGRLVGASSPIAGVVEIHEMVMDGNVMRMRAIPALELPPGQPVALRPGGHHVMLMDLKQPVAAGQTVAVTLTVEGRDGRRETIEVQAPVRPLGASAVPAPGHGGHHGMKH